MDRCPLTDDIYNCFKTMVARFPIPVIIAGFGKGEIFYLNEQAKALMRINSNENSKYHSIDFYVNPSIREDFLNILNRDGFVKDYEIEFKDLIGVRFVGIVSSTIIEYDGSQAIFSVILDITTRKRTELALLYASQHDHLTNVFNRRHLLGILKQKMERAKRYNNKLSFLMIDVDNFKHVNDTFGHLIGDEALKWLCIIMQSSLRQTDYLGRLGGEEFGIILTETDKEGALYLAERIRKTVERNKFCQDNIALKLTISIGLTNVLEQDNGIDILRRADKGLLSAKESGKNKVISV